VGITVDVCVLETVTVGVPTPCAKMTDVATWITVEVGVVIIQEHASEMALDPTSFKTATFSKDHRRSSQKWGLVRDVNSSIKELAKEPKSSRLVMDRLRLLKVSPLIVRSSHKAMVCTLRSFQPKWYYIRS
jgi:hypothetical protein